MPEPLITASPPETCWQVVQVTDAPVQSAVGRAIDAVVARAPHLLCPFRQVTTPAAAAFRAKLAPVMKKPPRQVQIGLHHVPAFLAYWRGRPADQGLELRLPHPTAGAEPLLWLRAVLEAEAATAHRPLRLSFDPAPALWAESRPFLRLALHLHGLFGTSGWAKAVPRARTCLDSLSDALSLSGRAGAGILPASVIDETLQERLDGCVQGDPMLTLLFADGLSRQHIQNLTTQNASLTRRNRALRRIIGRAIRRAPEISYTHFIHASLRRILTLAPLMTERRAFKLGRSMRKRDPRRLAALWVDDRTPSLRFFDRHDFEDHGLKTRPWRPEPAGGAAIADLAVVIHVFYPDVLEVLVAALSLHRPALGTVYVTCRAEIAPEVRWLMDISGLSFRVIVTENRGRDVRPFLQVIDQVARDGHGAILKLHTKKSPHRHDGNVWAADLFRTLLLPRAVRLARQALGIEQNVGLIAPAGHILPISPFIGENSAVLAGLAGETGISLAETRSDAFSAGTMFYIATPAAQMLAASLHDGFEEEAAQTDGTRAHGIERLVLPFLRQRGWRILTTEAQEILTSDG